jgi:nitroimidazol reductase NimA-like FMN-containing flavoprotein (pyridoxamine 5'-phosphate oxidase superfamily)
MERHHLRRSEKQIADENDLRQILVQGKYATIALCRNNEPYVVTLSYGYDQTQNALFFHTGSIGLKIDFISCNPAVCATVIEDGGYLAGECNHRYRSLVINGKMSFVESLEGKKHGLAVMLNQLEENPSAIQEKLLNNDHAYAAVCILRLDIDTLIGKSERW